MSGRAEKEKWFEEKNKRLVDSMPIIAKQFYVYFKMGSSKKTEASCFVYLTDLNQYFTYLKMNHNNIDIDFFNKIKPVDITVYLDYYRNSAKKPKADSTVAVMFNVIKAFYTFLEDNEYIKKNPCSRLKAPKVQQPTKTVAMTKGEINKVKDYILYADKSFYHNSKNEEYWRLRDYLIFTLGCRTGLRCSAIVAIDIEDIDLEKGMIVVVEKGNVKRNIYFGSDTKDIIEDWMTARGYLLKDKRSNALFISKYRTRLSTGEVGNIIKRYTSEVIPDKHITPHKMRSTCATNLWEQTHDIYIVANQLGHKNLANTKRYTDISENESRKVANILDEL